MSFGRKILLICGIGLVFTGCNSGPAHSSTDGVSKDFTKKSLRGSTYITKGNFTEIAQFAYKKVTDSTYDQYALPVILPGSDKNEAVSMMAYEITAYYKEKHLKKIKMANYQNILEIKFVDNRVNILWQSATFTVDRQMDLDDFIYGSRSI